MDVSSGQTYMDARNGNCEQTIMNRQSHSDSIDNGASPEVPVRQKKKKKKKRQTRFVKVRNFLQERLQLRSSHSSLESTSVTLNISKGKFKSLPGNLDRNSENFNSSDISAEYNHARVVAQETLSSQIQDYDEYDGDITHSMSRLDVPLHQDDSSSISLNSASGSFQQKKRRGSSFLSIRSMFYDHLVRRDSIINSTETESVDEESDIQCVGIMALVKTVYLRVSKV